MGEYRVLGLPRRAATFKRNAFAHRPSQHRIARNGVGRPKALTVEQGVVLEPYGVTRHLGIEGFVKSRIGTRKRQQLLQPLLRIAQVMGIHVHGQGLVLGD